MKKSLSQLFVCILFIFGLFFFVSTANAQMPTFDSSSLKVSPQFPKANEQVTVTLSDFSSNLNAQTITWSVNGVQKQSGIGLKSFTFTTGALGTVYNVSTYAAGKSNSVSIRPTEVDLVWQATDSYVPPFYEGKALFPNQGNIVVSAIPHFITSDGTRLDPKKLIYKWKKGGGAIQDQSGYGRDTINITGTLVSRPTIYEVEVTNVDDTYKGVGMITINEVTPSIRLYENDPLYGIEFEKSLNDTQVVIDGAEMKLTAVPFFFSINPTEEPLQYSWLVNNRTVSGNISDSIVLRNEGNAGISSITSKIKHPTNFMQFGQAGTRIETKNQN